MSDPAAEWGFLGPRVLVVSRFPPARDGIARYAAQLDDALRAGRTLRELGIPLGGGDRVRALWGGLRPLRILLHSRGFPEILVHYHPHYYVRGGGLSRLAGFLALGLVARARRTSWVVHEVDGRPPPQGRKRWLRFRYEEALRRWMWRGAHRLVFHSDFERRRFDDRYPAPRGGRAVAIVSHSGHFTPATDEDRSAARRALGLDERVAIVLCIGFLSPHKNYEAAVAAIASDPPDAFELHVVGTPIRPMPDVQAHVERLRALARAHPWLQMREEYVSDEDFDRWVRAADAVLTPYAEAASSGVMARAQLLGTPVITSAQGGMAEQATAADHVVGDGAGLLAAVRQVAAGAGRART